MGWLSQFSYQRESATGSSSQPSAVGARHIFFSANSS